jgi:hypothetical protein
VTVDAAEVKAGYGNWRPTRTPGLLGLSTAGLTVSFGGLFCVIIAMMAGGWRGAVTVGALVAVGIGLVAIRDRHGLSLGGRIGMRLRWWQARAAGANLYRSGPLGVAKWGTCQLPGVAARLRLLECRDSYDRPFAVVHSPSQHTYSVVFRSEPQGSRLQDKPMVDIQVAGWARWLAQLGEQTDVLCAQVVIETAPDSGLRLKTVATQRIDPASPQFAREVMTELADLPAGSSSVSAFSTITFRDASLAGTGRKAEQFGRELAARLPGFTSALQETGAGAVHPVSAAELCEVVRTAYDPAAAVLFDEARVAGVTPDIGWADAGPSAAQASWDGYRHDSAWSRSWMMSRPPMGIVQSDVLARLLEPDARAARKRVALLYRPLDPGVAAAMVEADVNAASFAATSGQKVSARQSLDLKKAQQTAAEEAAGAGLVEFGLIVTATVMDAADKADAVAAVEQMTAATRLRMRPAYGCQDSVFAAGLPIGIWLPKYLTVPTEFRDQF